MRTDTQTQGRGRRNRVWESAAGNFFGSCAYHWPDDPQGAARLSFVAAVAVAQALEVYPLISSPKLSWPNDVKLGGCKVAGILLETYGDHIVIGIGVNLTTHPDVADKPATHVLAHISAEALNDPEPPFSNTLGTGASGFLPTLAKCLDEGVKLYKNEGFAPIRNAWTARAEGVPGPVTVRLPNETFTGHAQSLLPNGALRVRTDAGTGNSTVRDVHAGDVFFGVK